MNDHSSRVLIEADNLVVRYAPGRTILNNVSLRVRAGEAFTIIGGSGCGKSTLLNVLVGQLAPVSGRLRVFGEDPYALRGRAKTDFHRRLGILFQSGALLQSLSLAQNVELPLGFHHPELSRAVLRRSAELKLRLVRLGVRDDWAKFPADLSGGMKKRAGLARALALDPEIVFADEPASGLDPVGSREMDELFGLLTRRIGAAAVIVSHDVASFWRSADRAMFLGGERDGKLQGRVIFEGTKEDFARTDLPQVRNFLGDPPSEMQPHRLTSPV